LDECDGNLVPVNQPPQGPPSSALDLLFQDRRAMVDAALPPVVFVTVNAFAGLKPAAYVAIGLALVFVLERLVRRAPVINAVGGVLGTGIAVFIALRTGSAEGYFVPRALQNAGLAILFIGSVAIRKPLAAYVARAFLRLPREWFENPLVRRPYAEVTLVFAGLFTLRAAIFTVLIVLGEVGALAAAALLLGWPAFALVALWAWKWVPRRLEQLGAPPPEGEDADAESHEAESRRQEV
jgi:hypothetical protein